MLELINAVYGVLFLPEVYPIIVAALTTILTSLTLKYFELSWRHRQEAKIELLKSEKDKYKQIIASSLVSLSKLNEASYDRTLKSIETIWSAFLEIKKRFFALLMTADVLTDQEWMQYPSNNACNHADFSVSHVDVNNFYESSTQVETARPFVDHKIWSIYFSYRAFVTRLNYIASQSYECEALPPWYSDQLIASFLRSFLSENEYISIAKMQIGKIKQITFYAESKIITEIKGVIDGRTPAESNLNNTKQIIQQISALEAEIYRSTNNTKRRREP